MPQSEFTLTLLPTVPYEKINKNKHYWVIRSLISCIVTGQHMQVILKETLWISSLKNIHLKVVRKFWELPKPRRHVKIRRVKLGQQKRLWKKVGREIAKMCVYKLSADSKNKKKKVSVSGSLYIKKNKSRRPFNRNAFEYSRI